MPKLRICKRLLAVVCVLIVLCVFCGSIVSHSHECQREACIICSLTDIFKNLFAAIVLCFAMIASVKSVRNAKRYDDTAICFKDETPVRKKVKLTN